MLQNEKVDDSPVGWGGGKEPLCLNRCQCATVTSLRNCHRVDELERVFECPAFTAHPFEKAAGIFKEIIERLSLQRAPLPPLLETLVGDIPHPVPMAAV